MSINVTLSGESIQIDQAVFRTLLDNSVAGLYTGYQSALESGSIKFADLVKLAKHGDIPYPLFFSPLELVEAQVEAKTQKLLNGIGKDTFQIGTRATVELREVELIVKDLIRKQELLKHYDKSLPTNKIVGLLSRVGKSTEEDATKLMDGIGLGQDDLRQCANKAKALDLLIERLESRQILVSRSVQNYMPQRLNRVNFSGMTIRDKSVPYIFLAGGDHGDQQEPVGRTIFTLTLMAVLVARRIFKPVTWDGQSTGTDFGREYDIAGSILMPTGRMNEIAPLSLDDVKTAAGEFKVTPSAVTVRAMRLGQISHDSASAILAELREEFNAGNKPKGMKKIHPENAIRKYAGAELSRRMLAVLDAGGISQKDFCRAVCLNHLKPSQIEDLRRVVN